MIPILKKFIDETPRDVNGEKNWKTRLLSGPVSGSLVLDNLYLGSQSVADILRNHVTDSQIDPKIIEAYHLQYPDLSNHVKFVAEVRKFSHDPEALRGFLGGIKGKVFEIDCVEYLNKDGYLPAGWHAELSAKANEPGVDILIKDEHGQVHQEIQAKALQSLEGIKEHLERYPDIPHVLIPSDQVGTADFDGLHGNVEGIPVANSDLTQEVGGAADQAGYYDNIHFPVVGFAFMVGEVAYLWVQGKPIDKTKYLYRGAKSLIAFGVGSEVFQAFHSFGLSIPATMLTRAVVDRYKHNNEFIQELERMRGWSYRWRTRNVLTELSNGEN